MRRPILCAAALLSQLAVSLPLPTRAQDASTSFDGYTVPDVPALDVLDARGVEVDRPATPGELGASLKSFYADGKIAPGIGVEITPRLFGGPFAPPENPGTYKAEYWSFLQLLSRVGLSVATQGVASEAEKEAMDTAADDLRLGVGARIVLFDDSDPYYDPAYWRAVHRARLACEDVDPLDERWEECRATAYRDVVQSSWTGGGLAVGVGGAFQLPGGKPEDADFARAAAWANAGVSVVRDLAQAVFGFAYAFEDDAGVHQGQLSARLRIGSAMTRGVLEGQASLDSEENWGGLGRIGIEHRISESFALEGSASYTDAGEIIVEVLNAKIGVL